MDELKNVSQTRKFKSQLNRAATQLRDDIIEAIPQFLTENHISTKITEVSESPEMSNYFSADLKISVDGFSFRIAIYPLHDGETA